MKKKRGEERRREEEEEEEERYGNYLSMETSFVWNSKVLYGII